MLYGSLNRTEKNRGRELKLGQSFWANKLVWQRRFGLGFVGELNRRFWALGLTAGPSECEYRFKIEIFTKVFLLRNCNG